MNHINTSDNERAVRSAEAAFKPISGGHLSAAEGAHIPLAARSLSQIEPLQPMETNAHANPERNALSAAAHCDWCAAADAYLLERRMAEWAMTRREQAEERKS